MAPQPRHSPRPNESTKVLEEVTEIIKPQVSIQGISIIVDPSTIVLEPANATENVASPLHRSNVQK
jgi:hypothetical protein